MNSEVKFLLELSNKQISNSNFFEGNSINYKKICSNNSLKVISNNNVKRINKIKSICIKKQLTKIKQNSPINFKIKNKSIKKPSYKCNFKTLKNNNLKKAILNKINKKENMKQIIKEYIKIYKKVSIKKENKIKIIKNKSNNKNNYANKIKKLLNIKLENINFNKKFK